MPENQTITITTRKQLDIYMNPQRQRLLKIMEINGIPMTPKQLSDCLGISASSVSHHVKKLVELGLLGLDHTESIHGIQAKFYKKLPISVSLGGSIDDDLTEERWLIADYTVSETWKAFKNHVIETGPSQGIEKTGDSMNGIAHLTESESIALYQMILDFIDSHAKPGKETIPWEYSIAAFPHSTADKDTDSKGKKVPQ